ncbi:MAG: MBL fold metallo-hydrolase [Deltaproteobacteria bacterium]|nr:MBL fold metallo-hydrolase [Deltaproteobacteria bacterium]
MIVKQLLVTPMAVFCYIVGCEKMKGAMVLDPGGEVDRIMSEIEAMGVTVKYIVNTHQHGDHTAGNAELKERTGAQLVTSALEMSPLTDIAIDKETSTFKMGEITFDVFHTPGHSPGGICLHAQGQLFTGDTLFVGDSGRTDLGGGGRPALGASIRSLMVLPDDTVVWPGHNYGPMVSSTLGWEKRNNVNAREYGYYVKD